VTNEAWLDVFRDVGSRIRSATASLAGTAAAREELGRGAGGDRTVEIDRLAEATALDLLAGLAESGERFSLLSEEVGRVDHGAPYPLLVLDPIDGSVNAKTGIPVYAVMLSLVRGPTVAEVGVGYTLNLVSGEQWHAVRGGGAFRNGERLVPQAGRPGERIDVLGLESSAGSVQMSATLIQRASKLRILGCMAVSLAHTASGAIDLFCSPIQARVFDMTAGLLMIEEVGGVVSDMAGRSLAGLEAGLERRTTVLASADRELHQRSLDLLAAG